MIQSQYQADGFAAIVQNKKAQIIGAVKAGQAYAYAPNVQIIFSPTLAELRTALISLGCTILN